MRQVSANRSITFADVGQQGVVDQAGRIAGA